MGYKYDWGYDSNGYPKLNSISMSRFLDSNNTVPSADTDWFDETTRTGVIQQYNVSVSNGSEKGSSFFSLGYYKNLGVIKDTDFERFSARMNSDYNLIGKVLTVGEHFTLNRTSEVQAQKVSCKMYYSLILLYRFMILTVIMRTCRWLS